MSVTYKFREDESLTIPNAKKANPQKIGEALEAIATENAGRLTPHAIVAAASNRKNPLHPFFEWDDSAAANAYRLDQARALVRIIRVDDGASAEPPRAFLSVSDRGTSYRSLAEVQRSPDLQTIVLRQAERDLAAFQTRYREMADICEIIMSAREKVRERLAKSEQRPTA